MVCRNLNTNIQKIKEKYEEYEKALWRQYFYKTQKEYLQK